MLREEAKSRHMSINSLASQIIGQHLHYNMNAPKAGLIPLSKSAITMLLDGATQEEIKKIADASAKDFSDMIILLRGELTVEASVDVLESWLGTTDFNFTRRIRPDKIMFVIRHEMGRKWSVFLSEYFRSAMEQLEKNIKLKISDNNIAIELDL